MSDLQDPLFLLPLPEDRDLGEGIEEVLRRPGLTLEEIVEQLYDGGWDLGADPEDDVLNELDNSDRPFFGLSDDRWVHLPTLLDGSVFTHRLSAAEVVHDVLAVLPDLSLLQLLQTFGTARLAAGGELLFSYPEGATDRAGREVPASAVAELGSLLLPAGTITGLGLAAGDLVGLSCGADGIEVMGIDAVGEPPEAARAYVLECLEGTDPQELDDVLVSLLTDVHDAFVEPWPPICELLDSWKVVERDGQLGEPGFDFEGWIGRKQWGWQVAHYGLTPHEGAVLQTLLAILRVLSTKAADETEARALQDNRQPLPDVLQRLGVSPELLEEMTGFLADALVSYALLDQWQQEPSWAGPLGEFCAGLEPRTPRKARVGLYWLWARALEGLGDSQQAEALLRKAERQSPDWPAVLVDLARYAGDRGDAATGLSLLRRLDGDANRFLREVLERFQPAPAQTLPRNAPCWCGSGRKFKQCHQRLGQVRSLAERAEWLYLKAEVYASETPWRFLMESLVEVRSTEASSEQEAEEMAWDGLVMDVLLFEGGALAEYVQRQGWLLPPDELSLAQQWLLGERSVYEVVEVDRGVGMTLRDLRTGDRAVVGYPLASEALDPGQLICTHLLPLPEGGFLEPPCLDPVRGQHLDELLALLDAGSGATELVGFLSRRFAVSQMRTPEGDPLVLSHLELTSPDPGALSTALDAAYQRSTDENAAVTDPEVAVWHKFAGEGEAHLHASLTLRGSDLAVETASRERLAAVRSELLAAQPGLTVVDEEYQVVDADLVKRVRAALASSEGPQTSIA